MKKVGILSINLHSLYLNYGAALHSFAFQKYLSSLDINSVIIDYKSKHFGELRLDFPAITYIKQHKPLKSVIVAFLNTPSFRRKYKAFHKFYKENCVMVDNNGIPFTYEFFNNSSDKIHFDFSIVVCESDVIWSPKTSKGFDRVFFCDYPCFADKIKIAYAPSISNTLLNSDEERDFKKLITNFDFLSTREKQTAEYIRTLTDKKVTHVLDPVLLLDGKDYESYLKPQGYTNYLLVYNCMKNDRRMIKFAMKVAKEQHLKLIEISDFVRNKIHHKTLTGRSIGEFLWLIKNSSHFITNSFHGACFAILWKKDFLVCERDGVDLKVKSLLEILNLENLFVKQNELELLPKKKTIFWDDVYTRLNKYREISKEYIEESIVQSLKN